jgi:hypothetical protein
LKGKKFLGVPVSLIIITTAIMLACSAAVAAFLWNQSVPSTVKILGSDVLAYSDEACTQPLTALTFPDIRAGQTTTPVSFWIKNTGDDTVYCAMAQSGLDAQLTLNQNGNSVPADPAWLKLATGSEVIPGYWQATATTTTLAIAINASASTIELANTTGFNGSGMIKIDSELINYTGKVNNSLNGCSRGQEGTTAVSHSVGAPVTLMQWVPPTTGNLYNLAPAGKLQVTLTVTAGASIPRSSKSWQTILEAKDTAY